MPGLCARSAAPPRATAIRSRAPPGGNHPATPVVAPALQRLIIVQLDDELLEAAAALDAGVLRSLDAIHLAAAQLLGDELTAMVT